MDHAEARAFAEQWVRDWNAHDIDALLKHFTDDIVFTSPVAARLFGGDGVVRGKGTAAQAAARARRAKARVACAASLLRWIYCMVVHGTSWDPEVASGAASCHDAPQHQAEAA